jgi:hypothetical protein
MSGTYETTDLAIAAWLKVHGYKLMQAGFRNGKRGAHYYQFEDPQGTAQATVMDYPNSSESQFDAAVRALKKLVYEGRSPLT